MTISYFGLIDKGAKTLMEAGIETSRLDAELIICFLIQKKRAYILARLQDETPVALESRFDLLIDRRSKREPMAYITGKKEFYGLEFEVSPDVLIPRPETELIVDTVLEIYGKETVIKMLDIGVGSGAISIALAVHRPGWDIIAIDSSADALTMADVNVKANNVQDQVTLRQSFHFNSVGGGFGLIVSNPPYIPLGAGYVSPEAKLYEPHGALYAGEDGLDSIREIIMGGSTYLVTGGRIIMEFGDGQTGAVTRLIENSGALTLQRIVKDLQGLDRVVVIKRK